MSNNQTGRAPAELWSLAQSSVWIERRAGVPEYPIHRRIATATVQELYKALRAGTIKASGCVDGGERRNISSAEWSDYRLTLKHTAFSSHHYTGAPGTPVITVHSIRSLPAAALKYHGLRSRVRIPSSESEGGEPAYHRVIQDVLLPREEVVREWPSGDCSPLPDDRPTKIGLKAGQGAKTFGIEQAMDQLWPNGIPEGLTAKERNKAILDRLKSNGCSVPTERTIQRALKTRLSP